MTEILPSAVPDVLWHGTSVLAAANIIFDNKMFHRQFEGPQGISFTSDIEIAKDFGARNDEQMAAQLLDLESATSGVLLRFDGRILSQHYRFQRHFWDRDYEAEWRAIAPEITDIMQLVTGVFGNEDDIKWWAERYPDKAVELKYLGYFAQNPRNLQIETKSHTIR